MIEFFRCFWINKFIGFSLNYLSQALCTFAMIGFCRRHFPKLAIVVGGGLITSWISRPEWQNPFTGLIDHLIAGPGAEKLLDLLGHESQKAASFAPDYSDFSELKYLAPGRILPYAASSGCYWNKCLFCPETAEENPYRSLSPEQVLADLQILLDRHRPILIHFLDNAVSPALMKALVQKPPGVPWYGFARASPLLADEEFCRSLRRSGCVMLKLGLESGDQQVLDRMHKGIELAMVAQVLHALKSAGILTYVYLLFGTPSEDEAGAVRTMEFAARHHAEIGFLNLAVIRMDLLGNHLHQGGLAGPVTTDQTKPFPRVDGQGDVIQQRLLPITELNVAEGNQRHTLWITKYVNNGAKQFQATSCKLQRGSGRRIL